MSQRGTLDGRFDKSQALDAVFSGRERAIDLVREFTAHSRDDGPRKIRVKVGKRL